MAVEAAMYRRLYERGVITMYPSAVAPWGMDWVWSLPLIVTTVIVHVIGLMLIFRGFIDVMSGAIIRRHAVPMFILSMAAVSLLAVLLHGFEGTIWAASYRLLGALSDYRSAMLYSLSAMTPYGHATVYLDNRWELMGALESLNGTLLFGLTTAFLYAMIREVWDLEKREQRKHGVIFVDSA
jgi:hypothetical protein